MSARRGIARAIGLAAALVASLVACGRLEFDAPPGADAPPGDRDGDLVPDPVDNCPDRANPTQHDEDGDARGDACDGCPHLAAAVVRDADGDGVEDACDPAPATPGNRIVEFLSFDVAPDAGWQGQTSNGAVWREVDDDLTIAMPDAEVAHFTRDPLPGAVVIELAATVDTIAPPFAGFPYRNLALIDDVAGAPPSEDAIFAGIIQNNDTPAAAFTAELLRLVSGGNAGAFAAVGAGAPLATTRYRLRYQRAGDDRTLEVLEPAGAQAQITGTAAMAAGRLGVRVRGLTARVHYVVVLQ